VVIQVALAVRMAVRMAVQMVALAVMRRPRALPPVARLFLPSLASWQSHLPVRLA
jgi:hypothetical protein